MRGKFSFGRLEAVAFVVGMAILTFELTAARIVAPYMGDTIYTWTSIIGVILAALALGYTKGGAWADERKQGSDIVLLLLGAASLIAFINLLKDPVLAELSGMKVPLQLQAFTASLCLFAAPTFMLGMTSPYLARLTIINVATSGRHLSRVDAASTLGSLVGTFITGYLLFGIIGSRNLLTLLAVGLILTSLIMDRKKYLSWQLGTLVMVMLFGVFSPKPMLSGFISEIDTAYSRVIVRDIDYGGREARVLQTDSSGFQSGIYTDGNGGLPFGYVRGFAYAAELRPEAKDYFIIGGGAFTFPQYMATKEPNAAVDTIEIDNKFPEISRQYFNFQQTNNLNIIEADGRQFLNQNGKRYGMIFLDAFSSTIPPFQLLTSEAVSRYNSSLTDDGVLIANIIAATEGYRSGLIRHVYSTFRTGFDHAAVYKVSTDSPPTSKQNLLVLASKQILDANTLSEIGQANPEFGGMLQNRLNLGNYDQQVMTDDYAPVEQLAF